MTANNGPYAALLLSEKKDRDRSTGPWRTACSSAGLTAWNGAVSRSRRSAGPVMVNALTMARHGAAEDLETAA